MSSGTAVLSQLLFRTSLWFLHSQLHSWWDLSWGVFPPLWKLYQEAMLQVWKLLQAQEEYGTDYPSLILSFTCSHPWGVQPRKDPFSSCALSSEFSEAELGLHFLPAGAGWIAESHLAQFPGPWCSLATTALNTNTSRSILETGKWIFSPPFLCVERFSLPDLSLWVSVL